MSFRRIVLAMLRMFCTKKIAKIPYWLLKGTYYTANHRTNHFYGLFTLTVSRTGAGNGTWARKNGLYGFKNPSYCTWTVTGTWTGTGKNGLCTHFSGPEAVSGSLFWWYFNEGSGVQSWPQTQPVWIFSAKYQSQSLSLSQSWTQPMWIHH